MKPRAPHSHALGVTVTPRSVYGVLLASGDGGPSVVRRFTRSRSQYATVETATPAMAMAAPEGEMVDDGAMIQFGAPGGGGGDLFLAGEFGDLSGATPGASPTRTVQVGDPFDSELRDLLDECRDALDLIPSTSIVADRDVSYVVVESESAAAVTDDKRRKLLLAILAEQFGDADAERVAFEPMTPGDLGAARWLAVAPMADDAAVQSVKALREISRGAPPVQRIDSEVSLLVGLARSADDLIRDAQSQSDDAAGGDGQALDLPTIAPSTEGGRTTLVVRASGEDTLVLALSGQTLSHYGSLNSLTAYDAPETICSRLLLQQDEHGIGEIDRILVLSDHQEHDLAHYLGMFFPDARIHSVRDLVPHDLSAGPEDEVGGAFVLAYAAAHRMIVPSDAFPRVNLLPAALARRRFRLPYSWHVYALILLVAATAFFFSGRYVMQENELAERRTQVAMLSPETATATASALQSRIDSVQTATLGYLNALEVLDSLLIGSDRWSNALEEVSAAARGTQGLWIESWTHDASMTKLSLSGTSTARDGVVTFADRVGGDIETLSFADVRDFPVYSYTLTLGLGRALPEAAEYLRAQAAIDAASDASLPTATASLDIR